MCLRVRVDVRGGKGASAGSRFLRLSAQGEKWETLKEKEAYPLYLLHGPKSRGRKITPGRAERALLVGGGW